MWQITRQVQKTNLLMKVLYLHVIPSNETSIVSHTWQHMSLPGHETSPEVIS